MKKLYMAIALLLTIFIITSSYSYASPSFSTDNQSGSSESEGSSSPSTSSDSDVRSPSDPTDPDTSHDKESESDYKKPDPNNDTEESLAVEIVSINPNPAKIDEVITFVGTVFNVEDVSVVLTWDFGDYSEYQGNTVTHSYSEEGDYTVKLTATNNNTDYQDTAVVEILPSPSIVDAGGPYFGKVNEIILFQATFKKFTITKLNDYKYEWKFGDGKDSDEQNPIHTYKENGNYEVTLTVTGNGETHTDTADVTIGDIFVSIHPSITVVNKKVFFGVDVINFESVSYEWDFGDGNRASGQSVSHIYSQSGSYYGKIYVETKSRDIIMSDFIIYVTNEDTDRVNRNPVPTFSISPNNGDTSTMFEFDASRSLDRDGEILTYEWYFGDGSMILTRSKKCYYSYDTSGEFDVICIIGDDYGGYSSYSRKIVVSSGGGQGGSSNNKYGIKSIDEQKGLMIFSGEMKKNWEEPEEEPDYDSSTSDPQTDSPDQNNDLRLSVSYNNNLINPGATVTFSIRVEDKLDSYDVSDVLIELSSDIPRFEEDEYYARFDSSLDYYKKDVDMTLPSDQGQYFITFTAKPLGSYHDVDWSDNRWSEMISIEYNDDLVKLGSSEYGSISI